MRSVYSEHWEFSVVAADNGIVKVNDCSTAVGGGAVVRREALRRQGGDFS
jgi:hypothetical protein